MQSARTTVLWPEALKRKKRDWWISQKYQMESLAFKTGFQCYGVREWPKGVYLNSGLWI